MWRDKIKKTFVFVFYLILNILFSITIVLLNKWLYIHIKFPNMTLTMIHFFITFFGLLICHRKDVFDVKYIDIREILFISITFCGFVVLTNLSLGHNTIGTYQVTKMLTTPCVILMEILFYKTHFSNPMKLTLIPIIVGIIINFYYDIQFNVIGTVYATLGVLMTSLYQILLKRKQKELQMDAVQLLYYQAPLSSIMLLVVVSLLEPIEQTLHYNWTFWDIVMVILSGVLAFAINLTTYWIRGRITSLTYSMAGHVKFCFSLLGGAIIFHETLAIAQVIGMILTLIGNILHAHIKVKDNKNIISKFIINERKPLFKTTV